MNKMKERNRTFYSCKFDCAFKEVFMKEENQNILICLLEEALDIKIKDIKYLNLEENIDNINLRRRRFDMNLKTDIGEIEIEVNTSCDNYIYPRSMAHICDRYAHSTLKGEEYSEERLIMQLNLNYNRKPKEEGIYNIYKIQTSKGRLFVKNFYIYEFYMDKLKDIWYSKEKSEIEKYKYLIMLDLSLEELEILSQKDRSVEQYMKELKRVNANPEFREYMSAEQDAKMIENSIIKTATEKGLKKGMEQGIEQGIEKGKEQGLREAHKKDALAMLHEKIDISIIAKCTGLSIKEIKELK